jgi:DICT domain-containing protein
MPNIVIDPAFSVYELVDRIKRRGALIHHRRTMSLISYQIEDALIKDGAKGRVFAGFQRMSKFLPQVPRYERLAVQAESIYVFGIPDAEPPAIPNITYVPLKADFQLAKEWFLVIHGPAYQSLLATEELSDGDDPDESRIFQGVWAFDADMVQIIEEWLTSAVDARPLEYASRDTSQKIGFIKRAVERLNGYAARHPGEDVAREIGIIIEEDLRPQISAP